jgi:phage host-nuclease inhibitor protein Gam
MTMQAESLEVLEKASVAPAQARAIVRAIEIEIAGAKDTLATKQDVLGVHQAIDVLRAELCAEMAGHSAQLRGEMTSQVAQLRGEITSHVAQLRGEMTSHVAQLREEMTSHVAQLRGEMIGHVAQLRGEITALGAAIRVELAEQIGALRKEISGVTRQMYVALLGQTAVMLGFFYFFITQLR